jgi:Family of unknown function (DUF6176)
MNINVELTRFKVKEGKSAKVDEWMEFLNKHMNKVLLTLKDEKMYVETIFREKRNGVEYLYWYSIQGNGGQSVEESNHWVDHIHLQYWKECIDPNEEPLDLNTEVVMIHPNIQQAIIQSM